jgi:hypothetical protein
MNKIDEKAAELSKQLKADLGEIELKVTTGYTLADAIRDGSKVSKHNKSGWGDGETACALTAGVIAAKARGWL